MCKCFWIFEHLLVVLDAAPLRVVGDTCAVQTLVKARRDKPRQVLHRRFRGLDEVVHQLLLFSRFNRKNIDDGDAFCFFGDRCHVISRSKRNTIAYLWHEIGIYHAGFLRRLAKFAARAKHPAAQAPARTAILLLA